MPGINAEAFSVEDDYDQSYDNYSFGFHVIAEYNHAKKNTDIVDIAYNSKLRRYVSKDGLCFRLIPSSIFCVY